MFLNNPFQLLFLFPLRRMIFLHLHVCQPVSKSGNCSNHVAARSILVSSNVSGHVKRFYQCKPVKAVCSGNVSKQNACNVSSVSKLVKQLTVTKPVCSTFVSKSKVLSVNTSNH